MNRQGVHLTSDSLPKKRSIRKKVHRPKHANNPFLVYSIYFTNRKYYQLPETVMSY